MSIETKLIDGRGSRHKAKVSQRGQLVTGTLDFSEAFNITLGTANTPVNITTPIAGKNFIITDILLYGNRNIGVNDATVVIYENEDGPVGTVQDKIILQTEVLKQSARDITGLNLEVSSSVWVNAITDDDDVFITMMGYYVEAIV